VPTELATAKNVVAWTGLSQDQLREWTGRRGIIAPDVRPKGPGTRALYSWQTVLLLRVVITLKSKFFIELTASGPLLSTILAKLKRLSRSDVKSMVLVIRDSNSFDLVDQSNPIPTHSAAIVVPLAPHLYALAGNFEAEPLEQLSFWE
jgi:hypothetical protein